MLCCTECKYCQSEGRYVWYCSNAKSDYYCQTVADMLYNQPICKDFEEVKDDRNLQSNFN